MPKVAAALTYPTVPAASRAPSWSACSSQGLRLWTFLTTSWSAAVAILCNVASGQGCVLAQALVHRLAPVPVCPPTHTPHTHTTTTTNPRTHPLTCPARMLHPRQVIASGKLAYHGPPDFVLPFFEGLGFRCPCMKGAADFLQQVTTFHDQEVCAGICVSRSVMGGWVGGGRGGRLGGGRLCSHLDMNLCRQEL